MRPTKKHWNNRHFKQTERKAVGESSIIKNIIQPVYCHQLKNNVNCLAPPWKMIQSFRKRRINHYKLSRCGVFARILGVLSVSRIPEARAQRISPNQRGFHRDISSMDQILLERRFKSQQPTATYFIDFRVPIDSVGRRSPWISIQSVRMTDQLLRRYQPIADVMVYVYDEEPLDFKLVPGATALFPSADSLTMLVPGQRTRP